MNDHAVKLNRRAVDSDLDPLEPAAPAAHGDPVAIHPSIHIGLSQISPIRAFKPLWCGQITRGRIIVNLYIQRALPHTNNVAFTYIVCKQELH
jgi:hypothetical protein